jgi:hypothetical protein
MSQSPHRLEPENSGRLCRRQDVGEHLPGNQPKQHPFILGEYLLSAFAVLPVGCDHARRVTLSLSALESLDFADGFDVGLLGPPRDRHFTLNAQAIYGVRSDSGKGGCAYTGLAAIGLRIRAG